MRRTLIASTLAAALVATALPSKAAAAETAAGAPGSLYGSGGLYDGSPHDRSQQISVFGFLPWAYGGIGFGVGGRFGLPLAKDGILPGINDSIELELGLDAWYGSWGYGFGSFGYVGLAAPVAEVAWTFHITDRFDAYAKLGLGWHFDFYTSDISGYSGLSTNGLYFVGGAGINYKLADKMTLRGELGYSGVRVGLGFAL